MRIVRSISALLLACIFCSLSYAAVADRISGALTSGPNVTLRGNVHHQALPEHDQGPVDPALRMGTMTLLTMPSASQQKALKDLVTQQQDRRSPNYHKWLTPEEWADRFGLSQNDAQQIAAWLKAQGFEDVSTARGRNWISFTGNAAQVQSAFGTEIHRYNVAGEMHFANATAPQIPEALSGIVVGFRGLDDFRPKPMSVRKTPVPGLNLRGDYYDSAFPADFVAPGDIETIYDLTSLYNAGFTGTGQKLVIVGQTDVYLADLVDFRSGFSLPPIGSGCTTNSSGVIVAPCTTSNFAYVLDGTDPGVITDVTEADLDLEWSAAIAPGAQIIFVNSTNVFTSYYYAIDQNLGPVISMSYGTCEFGDNNLPNDEIELKKANSFGITFMNASGDSGAAECDPPNPPATDPNNLAIGGLAVGYPASSPEVTGVGGTAIVYPAGFSSTYWGAPTTNPANGGTAQNPPLPETAWNDNEELTLTSLGGTALSIQQSYGIIQSGGGASNCSVQTSNFSNCVSGFPQPSWQTVTIPKQAGARFSPDVSLLASPDFPGYIFCTPVGEWIGGTNTASSCAPGGSAGITNALALLNSSSKSQPTVVGGTSASAPVFAAIVTVLNQYLGSTGLGNINPMLYTLAATPTNGAFRPVTTGDNNVYCVAGQPVAPWPPALQCPGTAGSTGLFGYTASNADATTGYNLVTGLGSVDVQKLAVAWSGTIQSFSLTSNLSGGTLTVAQGKTSGAVTLTVNSTTGFIVTSGTSSSTLLPVTYSCSGLPSQSTCNFSPSNVSSATSVSFTVVTTPPTTARLRSGGNMRIFYAALLPGLFGIMFTVGSRRRSLGGMRLLGLIVVLGFSTLWLGSCGNSSSATNPGTPKGTSTVTVNATTGGSAPITASPVLSFTLTVN